MMKTEPTGPTVILVEDDGPVRESLVRMLGAAGLHVEAFCQPSKLLEAYEPSLPGCLLLDLRLPEMSGLELHRKLLERGCNHPFIIISGHGDVSQATAAMRQGAVDFLEKPFDRRRLLNRIQEALLDDADRRRKRIAQSSIQTRIDSLTSREKEVMELVVQGKLTKQIAQLLGIRPKTVDVHRSNITRKMRVESVAQLVATVTKSRPTSDSTD